MQDACDSGEVVTARFFLPEHIFSVVTDLIFTRTNMAIPDTGKAGLSDSSDAEDLFASPSVPTKQTKPPHDRPSDSTHALLTHSGNRYDIEQTRNAQLQKELEGVRGINEVIEGVVSSLECAKDNMEVRLSLMAPILRKAQSDIFYRRFRGPSLQHQRC